MIVWQSSPFRSNYPDGYGFTLDHPWFSILFLIAHACTYYIPQSTIPKIYILIYIVCPLVHDKLHCPLMYSFIVTEIYMLPHLSTTLCTLTLMDCTQKASVTVDLNLL